MSALAGIGAPWLLLARALRQSFRRGVSLREVLRQAYEMGNRSAWLVVSGLGFFGTVMVAIAHQQARRFTGNITVVGPAYFELLVREFGPLTVSLLAAARAAASSSAELASMTVNEQVEALEMSAGDPLADLVAPRVLASAVVVPALCVLGTVAATASAVATVSLAYGADGFSYMDGRFVDWGDVACGASKAVLCGLFIPAAASARGLSARGGAAAVGSAVTLGVVDAALGCLVIDFFIAVLFLLARA